MEPTLSNQVAVIGVDTGGTFTDLVLRLPPERPGEGPQLITHKLLSTPQNPGEAVIQGIRALLNKVPTGPNLPFAVVHGSTVATNALLELRGARTAFVTTQGFEDLLFIGRQTRRSLYDLAPEHSMPLIPDERTFGVFERVGPRGEVIIPLTSAEIERVVQEIVESGADSVAVCLLFSFSESRHEQLLTQALREQGLFVSASHHVLPEYREYERASTTVINAYVSPLMKRYLGQLSGELTPLGAQRLHVMQSSGGCISPEHASELGVHTVLSGPAGGVTGAFNAAARIGIRDIITFDMGGTSTDVSLATGTLQTTTEGQVAGLPIRVPTLAIHTVGAGGGSIAYLDEGGALRVGPRSAGAQPGPACYGLGGTEPTVTDAHVALGRLPRDTFLGGSMQLDLAAARRAIGRLATQLGASIEQTAWSIIQVANVEMERAIRVISIEKGFDPKEFTLVAFGGAGGLHAAELARSLGIPRLLLPPHPGLLSAWGMCVCDVVKTYSQGVIGPLDDRLIDGEKALDGLIERAVRELRGEARSDGLLHMQPSIDLRYVGQSFELSIDLPPVTWSVESHTLPARSPMSAAALDQAFQKAHKARYGHSCDEPVEMVAVRLRSWCKGPGTEGAPSSGASAAISYTPQPVKYTLAYLDHGEEEVPVYVRGLLQPGAQFAGPAIVTEEHSTTLLSEGDVLQVDGLGNLLVTVAAD